MDEAATGTALSHVVAFKGGAGVGACETGRALGWGHRTDREGREPTRHEVL
jgi:hypothetical protein